MKYFAKYLPVEGEIKEGDITISSDGYLAKRLETYYHYKWLESGKRQLLSEEETAQMKKVKLFLCSRDIQVGDKIYSFSRNVYDTVSNEHHIKLLEIQWRAWVKPIGEISPDATWVKDGDEFEEDEWREVWDSGTGWRFSDDPFFDPKYCYRKLDWVQVKGPCGHFH
jgi:hypothetical protein